jgi:minor extracellular serine protease Vpr
LRRSAVLLFAATALALVASAAAALKPIRRTFGEQELPRVRAGTITIPSGHASDRLRVIATLHLPPLAAAYGRTLSAAGAERRLDVASASSRAYLARVDAAQRHAVAELRQAIPDATVSGRFRILLDGVTVELGAKELPKLVRLGFVEHVYPSLRYTRSLDESPSLIGATQLEAATGASGAGIKIGVVDDGIDQTNPFFDPKGYQYPPGFPKGQTTFTTPKVIVARDFPGPGVADTGLLPLDRRASFHGTHVAGIAAGDAGTTASAGPDHPAVTGLSGVAPRAWLGNYRVFNLPTPIGNVAETPEIVAAFESAVADGMNIINFSGGGPQTDPVNDAMIETVTNTANAGVVPVIAAGNDRDDFGLGSVGSPGTAPDAISVAAVSNSHVFSPALTVRSPAVTGLSQIPFEPGAQTPPGAWASVDQKLVDVGTIVGTDGKPVDSHLCGPPSNINGGASTLPRGALTGAIALVSRGICTFDSKSARARAAGAVGLVLVDNRPGEANSIPVPLAVPAGMISDLDGARVRAAMATTGGRATIRIGHNPLDIETGRGGTITSFSSAGVTPFDHDLKPDISAPGGQILSSTLPEFAGAPFAVFSGTSMATPHISGAAALLLQLHPFWSPRQVKSALMSTAGPAWGDTAQTKEASVLLEGAGLAQLTAAADPQIFTEPQSLSFGDLDVNKGPAGRPLLVKIVDAGDGAGTWNVSLQPQSATPGTSIDLPATITLPPAGDALLTAFARAPLGSVPGDNYGFIVLSHGTVSRRIPYEFSVIRPGLEGAPAKPLRAFQAGDTRAGTNRTNAYRWPDSAFGPAPAYAQQPPVQEPGAEQLYSFHLNAPAVNFGVAVWLSSPGSEIDPWLLGSENENDVQGYAGTPVNVNNLMFDFRFPVGAAATIFPRTQRFYVAVDSGADPFTKASLPGQYLLRAWVDDLEPPLAIPVTLRVAAGRPTIAIRTIDLQSGVDPFSLVLQYGRVLLGAAAYDRTTGTAVFPIPPAAPPLKAGATPAIVQISDYQETKNVNTIGADVMPNTSFLQFRLDVVDHPAVTWLLPLGTSCLDPTQRLLALASATKEIASVTFFDGKNKIGSTTKGAAGLFAIDWKTGAIARGSHKLRAIVRDAAGKAAEADRFVRACGT